MGTAIGVTCLDCGESYQWDDGGGFFFHLLHCDTCGQSRSVGFDELGDTHLCYLKGLSGSYAVRSAEQGKPVREGLDGEPLDAAAYHDDVELQAGNCECGDSFRFAAPPRCPQCRSIRHEQTGPIINYD